MAMDFDWDDIESNGSSSSNREHNNRSKESADSQHSENNKKGMPPHQESDLGEAPEFPAISFTYDSNSNKLQVRDRRGNVKAEFTVMTVNGLSAYDLWKENHKTEPDTSYDAFIKDMKGTDGVNGKNGKNAYEEWKEWRGTNTDKSEEAYWDYFKGENGKSAFELWKEVHGDKPNSTPDDFFEYLKGQNGKDAFEVWQDLGYKNSTREDFFKWIASLVETQKGEDGKIYYPHFDGFTLYFTEDIEGKGQRLTEKDIRGKDGRTFEPKFEGTKLHFDDGEGTKTDPVELKGKDAFELWKEYHHKPDAKYEEFEEFFKGQNVQANHSYLDIKDFTCPVQTIDTNLICNVLDSGTSPDNLIKLRQEDIDKLREEGNRRIKTNYPYLFFNGSLVFNNWAGWFKEFSWWCAGADRGLLRMCPGDHSKYTGIGTVILFTAMMAWFSSFVAMKLVFDNTTIAAIFAIFWAAMIFFLDRFITNTMYSDGKVSISKEEFIGALPRILIAIFLGIVISAPLELIIFDKEIKEYIVDKRIESDQEYQTGYTTLLNEREKINGELSDFYQSNIPNENDPYFLKPTGQTRDTTVIEQKKVWDGEKEKYVIINQARTIKTPILAIDRQGYKAAYENFQSNYRKEKSVASDKLIQLSIEFDSLRFNTRNRLLAECDSGTFKSGLYDRLNAMHSIAMKEGKQDGYEPLFHKKNINSIVDHSLELAESKQIALNDSIETIKEDKSLERNDDTIINYDLITKFVVSFISIIMLCFLFGVRLSSEKKDLVAMGISVILGVLIGLNYEVFHYLFYYLTTPIGLIMLLFILIDISPVLYKMMLADGVYDNYLHQEKLLAQDKIRLSLARMLRNIEKGELKSLSPFIMGKIYRKLVKFSYSQDGLYNGEKKDYKSHIEWEETKGLNKDIENMNKEVFDIVLDYKKRIILASYSAWYRDMRDAMIGKKDDAEGSTITPEKHLSDDRENNNEEQLNNRKSKDSSAATNDNTQEDSASTNEESHHDDE